MGSSSPRKYPRLPTEQPGEIEVRVDAGPRAGPVTIPVSVRSLAPEGAGLVLHQRQYLPFERGKRLTLRLRIAGQRLELPASVAWCVDPGQKAGRFDIGVRIHLAMAAFHHRQAYAQWIVGQLEAQA